MPTNGLDCMIIEDVADIETFTTFWTLFRDKKKGLAFPLVIMVLTGARVSPLTTGKVLFSLNPHFLRDPYSQIVND